MEDGVSLVRYVSSHNPRPRKILLAVALLSSNLHLLRLLLHWLLDFKLSSIEEKRSAFVERKDATTAKLEHSGFTFAGCLSRDGSVDQEAYFEFTRTLCLVYQSSP